MQVNFILYFLSEILRFQKFDLTSVVTPVDVNIYEKLLHDSGYHSNKSKFLDNGFCNGFPLHYQGKTDVQMVSANLKLNIGAETELWNKVMKEVKLCFAGPFDTIPYDNFIQSPIGLVPKHNGKATRLIFHLSHPRDGRCSVNISILKEYCKVKYFDFNEAV